MNLFAPFLQLRGLRKMAVLLVAFSFLAVNFADAAHHYQKSTQSQMDVSADKANKETGSKKSADFHHCHGCVHAAMPSIEVQQYTALVSRAFLPQTGLDFHAYKPGLDKPPPKA